MENSASGRCCRTLGISHPWRWIHEDAYVTLISIYSDSTLVLKVDPNALPKDVDELQKLVTELCERLKHETSEKDKYQSLVRELLDAQRNRKSEQLSKDQQELFETLWKANEPDDKDPEDAAPSEENPPQPERSQVYGLTEQQALDWKENPIDILAPIAKARIPIIHVYGDADDAVPYQENTLILKQRYEALGGHVELIAKPGIGHHPHSLEDPTPIVNYILAHRLT